MDKGRWERGYAVDIKVVIVHGVHLHIPKKVQNIFCSVISFCFSVSSFSNVYHIFLFCCWFLLKGIYKYAVLSSAFVFFLFFSFSFPFLASMYFSII